MVLSSMWLRLWLSFNLWIAVDLTEITEKDRYSSYPTYIQRYNVRKSRNDPKQNVKTGLMELVGGVPDFLWDIGQERSKAVQKVPLREFLKLLDCSLDEPDLDEHTGSLSMLDLIPPTREILKLMCAWAETRCATWQECQRVVTQFNAGNISDHFGMDNKSSVFTTFQLLRVINGSLYNDWPWRIERLKTAGQMIERMVLLELTLTKINDVGDSVFFYGPEQPSQPWNFPFPSFAFSAKLGYNHMPWPWHEGFDAAHRIYKKLKHLSRSKPDAFTNEELIQQIAGSLPWTARQAKAAFYATYMPGRHLIFDQARLRPDLFNVSMSSCRLCYIRSWNPTSPQGKLSYKRYERNKKKFDYQGREPENISQSLIGSASSLFALRTGKSYNPGEFKYVVVPLGMGNNATSGRLLHLLAYSGAVILLQKSEFMYHISARLQPWVHYVPFSYSGADLSAKVIWLQRHDDLAQRIAENGRNFGRSYLRLEDYFCYAAHALDAVHEKTSKFDVNVPFFPQLLSGKNY